MAAEFFGKGSFTVLTNPGVESVQLVEARRSPQAWVSLTRVTVQPGAVQPRHAHEGSEQTWVALSGTGLLLLADGETRDFAEGDVARFPPGAVHGFKNTGAEPFAYFTVTTPPLDHTAAYEGAKTDG